MKHTTFSFLKETSSQKENEDICRKKENKGESKEGDTQEKIMKAPCWALTQTSWSEAVLRMQANNKGRAITSTQDL